MCSIVLTNSFNDCDTVLQVARCSFDVHLQDIMGTLTVGGTILLLRPQGSINFDYLAAIMCGKQPSHVHTVPTLLLNFLLYLKKSRKWMALDSVRSFVSGGK